MTFDTLTLAIPAHWLSGLVNGDTSGLDDTDDAALGLWICDTMRELGEFHVGHISDEAHFARYHDAVEYGVLACDCHDVTLCFKPIEALEAA